jgi:hypothetical protein
MSPILTVLEQQLAEAHALAIAATSVTARVEERVELEPLRLVLYGMRSDAEELRARCLEVERALGDELAVELLAHANTISERALDLAGAWFKRGTGPLSAWTFLAMGEAAEVTAWTAVADLAARADGAAAPVRELAGWAIPVQQSHLASVLEGARTLAAASEPAAPRPS